jgi:putative OPT family oligopeptide transporter
MPEATFETIVVVREFTARGFFLGTLLALLLGSANAYLGLYAGMTVSASIPAAVISMAVLRILGGATILENNVVQTIGSAGEAVAAGAIFTFPALVILGRRGALPYWDVTMLCVAGGTIGSLLLVFLRHAYIVDEGLPFPEGVACAEVLRAGAAGSRGAIQLAFGGIIAAALKGSQNILGITPGAISAARWVGGAAFAASANISAALLGVGYIVGIQITSLVFLGGAIAWFLAVPLASAVHPELHSLTAAVTAQQIWASETRYLGVGAMLVGGVATLWGLRGTIREPARKVRLVRARHEAVEAAREETDLPTAIVLPAVGGAIPIIFIICWLLSGSLWLSATLAFALALIGFFATAVAGYLSGIVGASNNPVSGVTIIVLLVIAILLKFLGVSIEVGPRLAIMAGAVVCTAAAMAGDSMQDLATGYHVGATPSRLEIAVLLGAIVSSFVMAPILNLLIRGYGIAGMLDAGTQALAAPQAFLMAKVAQGVFGGSLPWRIIAAGAALAMVLIFIGRSLERRNVQWRTPVMPVALGLYLPLGLSVTIFLGSLAGMRRHENSAAAGAGLLFAAGLVAGEALMGVAIGALVTAGIKLPLF